MIGVAVCGVMMFSLMGYLFGARSFYAIPSLSAIALQTATMLLALAIALIVSVPEHQPMLLLREHSTAGMMARTVLPTLVVMIPSVIWLRVNGENLNLYDAGTSRALGAVALIFATTALMWAALLELRRREQRERESEARLAGQKEALQAAVNGETLDVCSAPRTTIPRVPQPCASGTARTPTRDSWLFNACGPFSQAGVSE